MTRTTFGLLRAVSGAIAVCAVGAVCACGSASLSAFDNAGEAAPNGSADAGAALGDPSAAPSAGKDLTPVDNAVILVHAAKAQSFRLCFVNEADRRPQPDSEVMPQANVVGVEVGSAVRLGPLRGAPGKVYLFEESLIRAFYPAFGGAGNGPACKNLLESASLQPLAQDLGDIDTDLSHGVHLLVVKGCSPDSAFNKYSVAQCGAGWTSAKGNLTVSELTLTGANRTSPDRLPAQVVNLSQPLEGARAGRDVVVTFGDLTKTGEPRTEVTANPPLFGAASPFAPAQLDYASSDTAAYASFGFRVQYGTADGGAGASVLDESLAQVQKQSSPRDVPPTYYAAASNYALLLLGDPDAKLADGGADDDERRKLHFLAVPVIAPKADGGTDPAPAPAPAPADGGGT